MSSKSILLIDSECALCNKSVSFIISHGGEDKFEFISLYSDKGKKYLQENNLSEDYDDSIVLINNTGVFVKTDALLRVVKKLNSFYSWMYIFRVIPQKIRDAIYDLIAKHRHKILS